LSEPDALVGLRFEVTSGLGRMSGRIVGKSGGLYLIAKTGADHMELLMPDDLRSARFYFVEETEPAAEPPPAAVQASAVAGAPTPSGSGRRRLSDKIRKHLTKGDG